MIDKPINVLSLFDGISCGQIALNRAKIKYNNYFASEIDKYCITVTQANYPNTIQLGDVTKVRTRTLPKINLLLGGSPCQGFSFAGKGLAFDDPRSKLFFQYIRLLKSIRKTNPKVKFLLENVRMKKEHLDVITKLLGVKPICINSALVSAQNRTRYYWTNIKDIEQPKDKNIILSDILENGWSKCGRIVGRRINPKTGKRDDYNMDLKLVPRIELRKDNKSGTLTTFIKDNIAICAYQNLIDAKVKFTPSRVKMWEEGCKNITKENKSSCLTTKMDRWSNAGLIEFEDFL